MHSIILMSTSFALMHYSIGKINSLTICSQVTYRAQRNRYSDPNVYIYIYTCSINANMCASHGYVNVFRCLQIILFSGLNST